MKKILIIFLSLYLSSFAKELNLALAANVSYAIDDLIKEFNKTNKNTKVKYVIGSSGKLTAQIKNGAPYDLFLSANMKYPNTLYKKNLTLNKPLVYAKGSLALLSTKAKGLSSKLKLLTNKDIKRIAIANPKTAPYGIASKEALKKSNLYEKIKNKLIFGESISQTVSYTVTAADIGFIAKSSLYSKKMKKFKKNINWVEVDDSLYTPTKQGIVILKKTKVKDEAQAFFNFIQSKKAKNIFKKYGYKTDE